VEELASQVETLEAELKAGRPIELVRGGVVIAEVHAPQAKGAERSGITRREMPDFMGQMREIWGDTVFPEGTGTRWVREDRDARG
jgi:hypothetical protein